MPDIFPAGQSGVVSTGPHRRQPQLRDSTCHSPTDAAPSQPASILGDQIPWRGEDMHYDCPFKASMWILHGRALQMMDALKTKRYFQLQFVGPISSIRKSYLIQKHYSFSSPRICPSTPSSTPHRGMIAYSILAQGNEPSTVRLSGARSTTWG
jgi:hypothetical protein